MTRLDSTITSIPCVWKGVSATLQSRTHSLLYPKEWYICHSKKWSYCSLFLVFVTFVKISVTFLPSSSRCPVSHIHITRHCRSRAALYVLFQIYVLHSLLILNNNNSNQWDYDKMLSEDSHRMRNPREFFRRFNGIPLFVGVLLTSLWYSQLDRQPETSEFTRLSPCPFKQIQIFAWLAVCTLGFYRGTL